jgi:energy-coupling factor transport system ATP-binding protein
MFAFGVIGFLAGLLFRKGLLPRGRLPLSVFGAVTTAVLYGGIMNPASVLIIQPNPTREMFVLAYMSGFPFDLVHAAATATFLLILSQPMLEKLDRIKVKYGLM